MIAPYVPLESDRKIVLQNHLASINKLLKKHYKQVAIRKGRKGFATSSGESINRPKFYKQILEAHKTSPDSDVVLHGVVIPNSDVKFIVSLEEIRLEVISSISNMLSGLANKKIKNSIKKDSALSFEDLESEAFKSVLSSIHSYADENICFSTYFYVCANRDINNLFGRSNSMSKLSKKSMLLKRKYVEAKKSLSKNSNFEEVVQAMGINEKEIKLLRSTLNLSTISHDEKLLSSKYYAGIDGSKKYFSSGKSSGELILSSNNILDDSLCDGEIDSLDLSSLEKAVLDGVMQSQTKLGINSIAKNLINPKTGKPFSRMAVTYAWRRVKEKISNFRRAA